MIRILSESILWLNDFGSIWHVSQPRPTPHFETFQIISEQGFFLEKWTFLCQTSYYLIPNLPLIGFNLHFKVKNSLKKWLLFLKWSIFVFESLNLIAIKSVTWLVHEGVSYLIIETSSKRCCRKSHRKKGVYGRVGSMLHAVVDRTRWATLPTDRPTALTTIQRVRKNEILLVLVCFSMARISCKNENW